MTITRVYAPHLWAKGLIAHLFYCGAMVASLAAGLRGHLIGWWSLAAQLLPGMWKGARRAILARHALPEYANWFRRYGWAHAVCVPLATWLWLWALVAAAFGSTIQWRGHRYHLEKTEVAKQG